LHSKEWQDNDEGGGDEEEEAVDEEELEYNGGEDG
jgi:hypothetical protein